MEIEVDKALEGQIEARVIAAERHKHEEALAVLAKESEASLQKELEAAKAMTEKRLAGERELLEQQAKAELELAKKKAAAEQGIKLQQLQDDAETEKAANKQLREQLGELMAELRTEKQARAGAELEAQKKFSAEEAKIREETEKRAEEVFRLKLAESNKKLADTEKALADAQRKAAQGSQQNQGEVLELDLEQKLREEFPYDDIEEVKKGVRGADLKQTVCSPMGGNCGMLLWETKNGKWQPIWVSKFKADIREAKANIGIIVSKELPPQVQDFKQLEPNVWVASPAFASRLAVALRATILQVHQANVMNANKDDNMEFLFQYLTGPEFRHRVEGIVESYEALLKNLSDEKRYFNLKWAREEKAINNVMNNAVGMYGDLQGITNRALPAIKTLELDDGLDDEAPVADNTSQPTLL